MPKVQDQITILREKEAQLKARRQLLEAKEQTKVRKDRERRIFLIGMAVEAAQSRGEVTEAQVNRWLEISTTRAWDREFLGLPTKA
jgi:hypothetical protein